MRPTERAVARVIATMRDNLGEPITVDDMARVAMFSKFHFTRIFQRVTGVSPGRFLAALRLQQAKRLLASTSLNVTDISMQVGYQSVGTFSARFARSVGLSPTAYRRLRGSTSQLPVEPVTDREATASGVICGQITMPAGAQPSQVFVGLFPSRIPEGRPTRCTVLNGPGPYRLERVQPGAWYVLAQSVPADEQAPATTASTTAATEPESYVATHGPLHINDTTVATADLQLAPVRPVDPPVLSALLERRTQAPWDSGSPKILLVRRRGKRVRHFV